MDHMRRHTIKLDHVNMVVLDEADEMLDMGFREDMELILGEIPLLRRLHGQLPGGAQDNGLQFPQIRINLLQGRNAESSRGKKAWEEQRIRKEAVRKAAGTRKEPVRKAAGVRGFQQ